MDNSHNKGNERHLRRRRLEQSIYELNSRLAAHEDEAKYIEDRIVAVHEKCLIIDASISEIKKELDEISMVKLELQKKLEDTSSKEKQLNKRLTNYLPELKRNQQEILELEEEREKSGKLRLQLRKEQEILAKLIAEEHTNSLKKQANLITSKQITGTKENIILEDLIRKGESSTLEFKSSLMTPVRPIPAVAVLKQNLSEITDPERKNEQLQKIKDIQNEIKNGLQIEVLKTIAAFMNTKGGILLIGVNDDQTISGIEIDYSDNVKGYDGWLQHLKNLIRDHLGLNYIPHIQVKEFIVKSKTVSCIEVQKASGPVFMDYTLKGQKRTDFFFRALNTTEVLDQRNQIDYINYNWPPNIST